MPALKDQKVIDVFGLVPTEGDVGIEIECEAEPGPHFPTQSLPAPWIATHDGSLRGISIEYVLSNPIFIKQVPQELKALDQRIKKKGTNLKYSFRAGVHVHVNCQQMTMEQVKIYAALYYALENVLVEWCGEDRVGNHFCLRTRDADGVLPIIGDLFRGSFYPPDVAHANQIRYASLNFCALGKYGSLEFRAMATEPGFERIAKWAKMLHGLREKSKEIDSIPTLLEHFSMSDSHDWLKETLGDFYDEIADQKDIDRKVWEGIHSAQDLLFYTTE